MKRSVITRLLLTLTMVLALGAVSFAQDYERTGSTFTFNGTEIVTDDAIRIDQEISNMEPGDTVKITTTYVNKDSETTEWYMENKVLDTLEERSDMLGGYSYKLTNVGPGGEKTVIFDSDAIGDYESPDSERQGLKEATNATEDYFFIQELKAGQSGQTVLEVGLDGESQINSYEKKDAELQLSYAVEKISAEDIIKHVKKTGGVKTGDDTNILLPAVICLAGILLIIVGLISRRKDRKDGDRV